MCFYRQIYPVDGLWQKVEMLFVQLLFCYFGPSFNPGLGQNFLEDRKSVSCCCMDQWTRALIDLILWASSLLPGVCPQNKTISLFIFTFVPLRLSPLECARSTGSLLHFMPACSCGTILTAGARRPPTAASPAVAADYAASTSENTRTGTSLPEVTVTESKCCQIKVTNRLFSEEEDGYPILHLQRSTHQVNGQPIIALWASAGFYSCSFLLVVSSFYVKSEENGQASRTALEK